MRRFLILALLGILLAACDQSPGTVPTATRPTPAGATQAPVSSATATGDYPAPEGAYPAPDTTQTADGYPAPGTQGPEFKFNLPVRASDAQVTGMGPAGVPVKLVNVARSGEVIGETTIGTDGTFSVSIPSKLIAGDRIAIMLGNTTGTNVDPNDFISGPGYQDYPLVGIMFASTVVE